MRPTAFAGNVPGATKGQAVETFKFRGVVRGTDKSDRRVRRVRTIEAPSLELAWSSLGDLYPELTKGLRDPSANVLPPVGWRIDGRPTAGYTD